MKLKRQLMWTALLVLALAVVESSVVVNRSLLRPRRPDACFSCRAEERPLAYPLVGYLNKLKDMLVRGINAIAANAKEYKLH